MLIRTRQERDVFLELTAEALRVLTGKHDLSDPKSFLGEQYDHETADYLLEDFVKKGGTLINYLQTVSNEAASRPTIGLHVAVRPTERLINRLHSWLLEILGFKVVLDFTYDPAIMGGAVIEWEGRYLDFSLLKKIRALSDTVNWNKLIGTKL